MSVASWRLLRLWCFLRTRVSSVALILCDRFRSVGVLSIALVIGHKRYTEGVCCQLTVASFEQQFLFVILVLALRHCVLTHFSISCISFYSYLYRHRSCNLCFKLSFWFVLFLLCAFVPGKLAFHLPTSNNLPLLLLVFVFVA